MPDVSAEQEFREAKERFQLAVENAWEKIRELDRAIAALRAFRAE
jgi:hypothetical protein